MGEGSVNMKAMVMTEVGGAEVLKLQEIPQPSIERETDVLVRVKASALNPVDAKQRTRGTWYPSDPPQILGIDGSGIVEATGKAIKDFKPGDEVFFAAGGMGKSPGNNAQFNVIDGRFAARKPSSVSFEEAAAVPCAAITAWESLFDHGNLQQGQRALIHAGAGGVGHAAIQLAKAKGALVCTTVSTDEKADFVRGLGADKIIRYRDEDFVGEVLDWTEGAGVDVALDLVGGETFFKTFSCVRFYGTVVATLRPDPNATDWTEARLRNLHIAWELMLTPMYYDLLDTQAHHREILEQCADLMDKGKLRMHISETFPLEKAVDAHRAIEKGHMTGKIVLSI
jgi:NADPH2:quinone reductase